MCQAVHHSDGEGRTKANGCLARGCVCQPTVCYGQLQVNLWPWRPIIQIYDMQSRCAPGYGWRSWWVLNRMPYCRRRDVVSRAICNKHEHTPQMAPILATFWRKAVKLFNFPFISTFWVVVDTRHHRDISTQKFPIFLAITSFSLRNCTFWLPILRFLLEISHLHHGDFVLTWEFAIFTSKTSFSLGNFSFWHRKLRFRWEILHYDFKDFLSS